MAQCRVVRLLVGPSSSLVNEKSMLRRFLTAILEQVKGIVSIRPRQVLIVPKVSDVMADEMEVICKLDAAINVQGGCSCRGCRDNIV